jgi:copper oxidase (laccase) domain-containing protein
MSDIFFAIEFQRHATSILFAIMRFKGTSAATGRRGDGMTSGVLGVELAFSSADCVGPLESPRTIF